MTARLALGFALLISALGPAGADERILNFISDVTVERNGDLVVVETIAVQAEGKEIRRGILRDYRTKFMRPDNTVIEAGLDVASVTRNGAAEDWTREGIADGVRLRIGSYNRLLEAGAHEYVINYRTTKRIAFFPRFDILYWRATGNRWTFAIDQAEARITLPEPAMIDRSIFFTGSEDDRGADATIVEQGARRIVVRTTKVLPPGNGLTVVMDWQKGVIAPTGGMGSRP